MPINTKGLNPRLAATVDKLAAQRESHGLMVTITRPDGTTWDGYFRNASERDEFITRAHRMGFVTQISHG